MFKSLLAGQNRYFKLNFSILLFWLAFYLLTTVFFFGNWTVRVLIIVHGVIFIFLSLTSFGLVIISFITLYREPVYVGRGAHIDFAHRPTWLRASIFVSFGFTAFHLFFAEQLNLTHPFFIFPTIISIFLIYGLTIHYTFVDARGTKIYVIQTVKAKENFLHVTIDNKDYQLAWSQISYKFRNTPLQKRSHLQLTSSKHEIYWPSYSFKLSAPRIIELSKRI